MMKIAWILVTPLMGLLLLASCKREQVLGPPKAVPVEESGALELNLMTFNVRYENPGDPGTRAWQHRVVGSVRMIHEEKPDIIGVQEAMHGQVADLWASLPEYEFAGDGRDDGKRKGEYSGIFFRRDRFQMDSADAGTFWLSDTPAQPGSKSWGNEIPRIATWIRLTDRATQRGFYVFNTHWDHRNQPSREKAAILISRKIDERRHKDMPVIITGDFNAVEGNAAVAYLRGESVELAGEKRRWNDGLIETYQALHPSDPERSSMHFWRPQPLRGIKVDHIFVSRGAEVLEAGIRRHDQPEVSDHYPVTAKVRFLLD